MRTLFIALLAVLCLPLPAEDAFAKEWAGDRANLTVIGASGQEAEYTICRLSVRGGLYFPGEAVRLSLVRPANPVKSAEGGSLEAVAFNTAQYDPTETGFVFAAGARRIALTSGIPLATTALSTFETSGDEWRGAVQVPESFGMYAVLLKRADGTRTVLGNVARVPKPQPRVGPWRQIMGEWGLPGLEYWAHGYEAGIASALARSGIGLVRREVMSGLAKPEDGDRDAGGDHDALFAACREQGLRVMATVGSHGDVPLRDAGVWMARQLPPTHDPMLTKWYASFARRHWTGGETGLWAVEHFNEPWEPVGISGWNSDSQRYRQLLKCIHDGVKSVDKRILIAGTSSVMNTEDKLLSGESRDHMRMLDLMTDHYVSLWAAYGPRVAEKHGIVTGETETWGAHSQVLLTQFMCQFLSGGQKWLNPATPSMKWSAAPGLDRDLVSPDPNKKPPAVGVVIPTPTTFAMAIWNALIQDREFKRLVFTRHLPYLYQFGGDADARFVLCGRVTTTGSGRTNDYPWWQVHLGPTGTIALSDPGKVIEIRDHNGNPQPRQADGGYRLIMDTSSYYLWSAKGAQAVVAAVEAGQVTGLRAVHIAPNGVHPGADGGTVLPVGLHNALNRTVRGTMSVTSLNPQVKLEFTREVELPAGADATIAVPLPGAVAIGLPLRFVYAPAGCEPTTHTEVVQTTVISKASPADATAWAALPGATVIRPQGEVKGSEIESIWLPFVEKKEVSVPTRRGEVKLAWDDKALHVSASVDAAAIRLRPRLATRKDDDYFYNDAWVERRFGALRPHQRFLSINEKKELWEDGRWLDATTQPGWKEFQDFLAKQPEMKRRIEDGSAKRWAAASGSINHLNYIYIPDSPMIDHLPFQGDSFQFAIDVDQPGEAMTKTHDLTYPTDILPAYWTAVPDSDYEFGLYLCDDGKPELWCLLAPGVPRGHYFCRQERGKLNQHAVQAECSVANADGRTTYRASIPWSELGGKPWPARSDVGFTFAFNAADGGSVGFGGAATKMNSLTMHPYWQPKPSNTIRWTVLP